MSDTKKNDLGLDFDWDDDALDAWEANAFDALEGPAAGAPAQPTKDAGGLSAHDFDSLPPLDEPPPRASVHMVSLDPEEEAAVASVLEPPIPEALPSSNPLGAFYTPAPPGVGPSGPVRPAIRPAIRPAAGRAPVSPAKSEVSAPTSAPASVVPRSAPADSAPSSLRAKPPSVAPSLARPALRLRAGAAPISEPETATPARVSVRPTALASSRPAPVTPRVAQSVAGDERPAEKRAAVPEVEPSGVAAKTLAERLSWLEEEAAHLVDVHEAARTRLALGELAALVGEREKSAQYFAASAEAPRSEMARLALLPTAADPAARAAAWQSEAGRASTSDGRRHAMVAATIGYLRAGDREAALRAIESLRSTSDDGRAALLGTISALSTADAGTTLQEFAKKHPKEEPALRAALDAGTALRGTSPLRGASADPLTALRAFGAALTARSAGPAIAALAPLAALTDDANQAMGAAAAWLADALSPVAARRGNPYADALPRTAAGIRGRATSALRAGEKPNLSEQDEALLPVEDRALLAALSGRIPAVDDDATSPFAVALRNHAAAERGDEAAAAVGSDDEAIALRIARELAATAANPERAAQASKIVGDLLLASEGAVSAATTRGVALWVAEARGDRGAVAAAIAPSDGEFSEGVTARALTAGLLARDSDPAAARRYLASVPRGAFSETAARLRGGALDDHAIQFADALAFAEEKGDALTSATLTIEALSASLPIAGTSPSGAAAPFALAYTLTRRANGEDVPLEDDRLGPLDAAAEALEAGTALVVDARLEAALDATPTDAALADLVALRRAAEAPESHERAVARIAAIAATDGPYASENTSVFRLEEGLRREAAQPSLPNDAREPLAFETGALAEIVRERLDFARGEVSDAVERLLAIARDPAVTPEAHRKALEGLAEIDGRVRGDDAAAALWHETIVEAAPDAVASRHHLLTTTTRDRRFAEAATHAFALSDALAHRDPGEAGAQWLLGSILRRISNTTAAADPVGPPVAGDLAAVVLREAYHRARTAEDHPAAAEYASALGDSADATGREALFRVRAALAWAQAGRADEARSELELAVAYDPQDAVAWGLLAEARDASGDAQGAAEACEAIARTTQVPEHAVEAWFEAGRVHAEQGGDRDGAIRAFEAAAAINIRHRDVFDRLLALYKERDDLPSTASLLARKLEQIEDDDERLTLSVELGITQAGAGDLDLAMRTFQTVLAAQPDHPVALSAYADLAERRGDYLVAEQHFVRLARLLPSRSEQRTVYARLGHLYAEKLNQLDRAEVAYKEILARSLADEATTMALVHVLERRGDVPQTLEYYAKYVELADATAERIQRAIVLAKLHETLEKNARRAEGVLDGVRKEHPTNVTILRALVEFYQRQKQTPAVNILLDRAAAEARRTLTAGKVHASTFETLATVHELRGRAEGAKVVAATHGALIGSPRPIGGADVRALDPRLDDLLAPEEFSSAFRALLAEAGAALDLALPLDLNALEAQVLPKQAIATQINQMATQLGVGPVALYLSSKVGASAVPLSSAKPGIVIGTELLEKANDKARKFLVLKALKAITSHSAALLRGESTVGDGSGRDGGVNLDLVIAAWLQGFNPSWVAPGFDAERVRAMRSRLEPFLPTEISPTLGMMALEAASALPSLRGRVQSLANAWLHRTALLGIGDPANALEAISWGHGLDTLSADAEARGTFVADHDDARDLVIFTVSDSYLEARKKLQLP
jgi:tetratricopeptide (TPR) repeat protein